MALLKVRHARKPVDSNWVLDLVLQRPKLSRTLFALGMKDVMRASLFIIDLLALILLPVPLLHDQLEASVSTEWLGSFEYHVLVT